MFRIRKVRLAVLAAVVALGVTSCASTASSSQSPASSGGTVKIAIITPTTGPLAAYAQEYLDGLKAGLKTLTKGTNKVGNTTLDVTYYDNQNDPATAVSQFKEAVGNGATIIGGSVNSAISLQLAKLAEQNKVLFVSGPAAADAITGVNKYTFRTGRQSWQDVETAKATIGDPSGKKVVVFAQDYAFGQANVAAVKGVLGSLGATVDSVLVPLSATDFTPFALKLKQAKPDLSYVAWAGDNTGTMFKTLVQQGVFDVAPVVTGLATKASYGLYGPATDKIDFISYYFPTAVNNDTNTAMINAVKSAGSEPDLFTPDGWVAAQMIIHAVEAGSDVNAQISALEGWTFNAPKGQETVRASDHALLQPMFQAKLVQQGGTWTPEVVKTVAASDVAPPESGS
jgi:branched-chain amino acid transport system substrate-binding protein